MAKKPQTEQLAGAADLPGDLGIGFLGYHPLNLDEKLRLTVPARFKPVLQEKYATPGGRTVLVVTISLDRHYRNASVYPLKEWQSYIAQLEQMPVFDHTCQQLHRLLTSLAMPCELDAQGRIRLDKKIAELAGLEKRIVVIGRVRYFEIWDEKRFDEFVVDAMAHSDKLSESAAARLAPWTRAHTGAPAQAEPASQT